MTKPIRSVTVNFSDGTQLTVISNGEEGSAYFQKENFKNRLDIYTVFIADGLERETPAF